MTGTRYFIFWIGLLCALMCGNSVVAQVVVTQDTSSNALSQFLAGAGVTVSNPSINCDAFGSGTFTSTASTGLGLNQGVVMATGRVSSIPQPATNFASTQFVNSGDAQLATLTTGTLYDVCSLEFDLIPQGNTLQFNYVFASEEYPEFVCSQYNDVFGFFISGPNPGGGSYTSQNIAVLPGSGLPVCINSVNPGQSGTYNGITWNSSNCVSLSNTAYYVNNLSPVNNYIVYNGMTTVFTATASVTPCQTYHLKLAIADVGDRLYDSGVFLQAYSFTSAAYSVSVSKTYPAGYTSTYRGCVDGDFNVNLSAAQSSNTTVKLSVGGTATPGVDYNVLPDSITIPAGQTTVSIPVNPIAGGSTGPKTVILSVVNICTGAPISSDTILINDNPSTHITASDSLICKGQSVQLKADTAATYSWSPSTGLSSTTIANPIATPTATTTYNVSMTWGTCSFGTLTQTIRVSSVGVSLAATPADTVCNADTIQLSATASTGVLPYKYLWNTGSTLSSVNATTSGSYSVVVTDSFGCTASAAQNIAFFTPQLATAITNINCFGASTGAINLTASNGIGPYTFHWNDGTTTQNRTAISAGTYTVTATDSKGCTATATATVTQPAAAVSATATGTNILCFGGSTGSINLAPAGGTSPYTYNWGGGITTQNRTTLTPGTYTVTVQDVHSCSATASATITQPASALSPSATTTPVTCFGGNNGSINVSVTGGTTPYGYNWGAGITTQNRTGLTVGNYQVTVTDFNGCSSSLTETITQPASGISLTPTATQVSCFAGSNGAVNLAVSGGTSPYSYNWGGGITTQNRSALTSGTYTVTVTDNNLCSATASATVNQPAAAVNTIATITGVSCFAGNSGSITLNVSGGTSPYTYNWGGGVTTQNRAGLGAGTYTVIVKDANSCADTLNNTITQAASAVSATDTVTNVSCFGGNNGAVKVTASGGTTPYAYNWGGGVTTQNRTGLTSGNYNVTVSDSNGCSVTLSGTVSQPASVLNPVATPTNVNCFGGNNGSVNLAVTGGTTPYSYNWGAGITSQNRTTLTSGTYTVTVTDNNLCSATASATVTQPASAVSAVAAATNVACFGGSNGAINVTPSGGTSPYTYNWGGGVTTQNRSGLSTGTYTVTVNDFNSCSTTASATITQPASALNVSATSNNVACFGASTGNINLTVTGGTSPYSYNWGTGITSQNRTNLAAGSYSVTVNDFNSCTSLATAVITQPSSAVTATATPTNISCFGGNNGAINITPSGGTTPYSYNWGGGITTQNRAALTAGNYTVTVSDSNSCSATVSVSITQPASAVSASATSTNAGCAGEANGTITLTVNGGTSPYTYQWNDSVTTQNRTAIGAGTYTVTVNDSHLCSATTTATITQPAFGLTASTTTTNITCFGGNNGAVNLTVSGGTTPYSYNWGSGVTSQNRSGLSAGTYTVSVSDAGSCSTIATAVIGQPASAITIADTVTNILCFGNSTGAVNIGVIGGTLPYGYNWTGGATTQNLSALSAGNYSVTVTDSNLCSATLSINVTQPSGPVIATTTPTNATCFGTNNGSVTLTASGGVAPYSFSWSDSATTQNRTNLTAGTYSVTVYDANMCSATSTATVAQPASGLTASAISTNVLCFGGNTGAINVSVSGGTLPYTYNWGSGVTSQNRTSLTAGNYTVTINDNGSCGTTLSVTIAQPSTPLSVTGAVTNVSCFASNTGAINITPAGGTVPYSYDWNGGTTLQNRNSLVAGIYNLTVTDSNLCSATFSATITQPASGLNVTVATTNASCHGAHNGSITLNTSGGVSPYLFRWNDGDTSANRTGVQAGNYVVTVTDANSCTTQASAVILQPAATITGSATVTPILCYGASTGSIDVTANGGTTPYSYNWGGGVTSQNRSNLSAGSYSVTVSDVNLCAVTVTATIIGPASPLATTGTTTNVACFGGNNGSITLTSSGGTTPYAYNWTGGIATQNRSSLSAGNYAVTVTDSNLCSITLTYTIAQPAAALNASATTTSVSCFSGTNGGITVTATGGTTPYGFLWNDGITTQNRSSVQAGSYTLVVTDSNNCSTSVSATVTQSATAVTATTTAVQVTCFNSSNGSIDVTTSGGTLPYSYNWGAGITSQNRSNLTAGTYTVTITDGNHCSTSNSATITQPASPLADTHTITDINCYGSSTGAINLAVTGGTSPYSYNWGAGVTTQNRSGLSAGSYNVTITDNQGCSVTDSASITQPASALSVTITSTNINCFGGNNGTVNLTAQGGTSPYSYSWNGGETTQNLSGLSAGNYDVTVSDLNNCQATAASAVTQPSAALNVTGTTINTACNGTNTGTITLTITGGTTPYGFVWNDSVTTQNRNSLGAGTYSVTTTDNNGCSANNQFLITQPGNMSIALTLVNVTCNADSNGSITVTISGGTPPYQYRWQDTSTEQNRYNIPAGNYSVAVTDANLCSVSSGVSILQPPALVPSTTSVNVTCFGFDNGSINLSVSGGTTPYNYNWGAGVTSQNRSSLTAGNYSVTINDANSCSAISSVTITQPATALTAGATSSNVSCFGGNNGDVNLTVSGGTTPYNFNWGGGMTTQNLNGMQSGTYQVTVTDFNQCSATASATVSQPASGLTPVTVVTNVLCHGQPSGSINLTVTGGTIPYTYNWGSGITTENRTALYAGNYAVTVMDQNQCSVTTAVTVTQPSAPLRVTPTSTPVSCYGGTTGTVTVTVSGGTPPYSYSWNGGSKAKDLTAVPAGVYTITVSDVNQCTVTDSDAVTQPASAVQVAADIGPVKCFGASTGAINLTVTGGTSPYSYNWGSGLTSQNRSNLAAGNYTVTISDSNSCARQATIAITQPTQLNAVANSIPPTCYGMGNGKASVTATGGIPPYTYNWGEGVTGQNRTNLYSGNYLVVVSDSNTCSASASATVTSPDSVSLSASTTQPSCYNFKDGSVMVIAMGGTPAYHFVWNTGDSVQNLTGVGQGQYAVTVTDANGCADQMSGISVTQPAQVSINVTATGGACTGGDGGQLTTTVTGGTQPYHYTWNNNASTANISDVAAGNYLLTVMDANNCSATGTGVITQYPGVLATAATTPLPCENATENIDLSVSSGTSPYTYKWNTGATTQNLNNVNPGHYNVTVMDANGCSFDTTFVIESNNNFTVSATGGGTITLGQSITLEASSNGAAQVTYTWSPTTGLTCAECSSVNAGPTQTTLYKVTGIAPDGCAASDTVTVTVIEDHNLYIPNAFSPNGDGNNDYFSVYGNLAGVRQFNVMIFNRWGEKVYESDNPEFKWDGTFKGVLQDPAEFVYLINVVYLDSPEGKLSKGSLMLVR